MSNNNYYEKRRYTTEKGIETIHDVKYTLISDSEMFEEANAFLEESVYKSLTAEKQRMPYYKKNLKLLGSKESAERKFETLVKSFLLSIDDNIDIDDLEYNIYQKAHENIYKIIYIKNQKFTSRFIYKDVVYTDEFELVHKKNKSQIKIMKSMKAPFSLDRTSLLSTTIRIEFRRQWKSFIKDIEMGLLRG